MNINEMVSLICIMLVVILASVGYLYMPKVNKTITRFTGTDMNKRAEYIHETIAENPSVVMDFNDYNKLVENGDASEWRKLYKLNEAQKLNKESIANSLHSI